LFEGKLSDSLLCAIVRAASSASPYRQLSTPIGGAKSVDARNTLISKVLCHLPGEELVEKNKITLRYLEMGFGWFANFSSIFFVCVILVTNLGF
jgi:hypothetical protein